MIYQLNEFTAAIAVALLLLCFRGFWPHMLRMWRMEAAKDRALGAIIAMILIVDVKGVARMVYWDVWRSAAGHGVQSLDGTLVNSGLNILAALAGVAGLAALFYSIPDADRSRYTWITAPFYPGRFWWMR